MKKYADLAGLIWGDTAYSDTTSFGKGIKYTLNWLDEHSDQLPKPTITESELMKIIDSAKHHNLGTRSIVTAAGVAVVPDPEPTNAERLAELMSQASSIAGVYLNPKAFAEWMDSQGVKAPELDSPKDPF